MKRQGAARYFERFKVGLDCHLMDLNKVDSKRGQSCSILIDLVIGTLVVHPILQPSTAYWMLRPFFRPTRNNSLNGWKFSLDDENGEIFLNGANPGTAQEHTPDHHPHLQLSETMIPYPTVEPGDTGR